MRSYKILIWIYSEKQAILSIRSVTTCRIKKGKMAGQSFVEDLEGDLLSIWILITPSSLSEENMDKSMLKAFSSYSKMFRLDFFKKALQLEELQEVCSMLIVLLGNGYQKFMFGVINLLTLFNSRQTWVRRQLNLEVREAVWRLLIRLAREFVGWRVVAVRGWTSFVLR